MPASFSANSIGFFLDLNSDPLRQGFKRASSDYTAFTRKLEQQNSKVVTSFNNAFQRMARVTSMFAALPAQAEASYAKSVAAIQRNIKPIKQPIEFVFGKDFDNAISSALEGTLSRAQFNFTPRTPGFAGRLASPRSVKGNTDLVGGVRFKGGTGNTKRVKKHSLGGMWGTIMSHVIGTPSIGADPLAVYDRQGQVKARINTNDVMVPRQILDPYLIAAAAPGVGKNGGRLNVPATVASNAMRRFIGMNKEMSSYASQMLSMRGRMDEARMYVDQGVIRSEDRDVLERFRELRAGYRHQMSLMNPTELKASMPILKQINQQIASMESGMAHVKENAHSVFSKKFWQNAAKNMTNPMKFIGFMTAMGRVRGAIERVAGEAPGSQEAFARYFAQSTPGGMQQGRVEFMRAMLNTPGAVSTAAVNASLTALMQNGFRAGSTSLVSGLAQAHTAYGIDAGVGSDILATLVRRSGVGSANAVAALASIGRNAQRVGAHGSDVGAILAGSGMLGAVEVNRLTGRSAQSSIVGSADLAARLFRGGGGDAASRVSTTNIMSMLASVGQGDLTSMPALAMLGIGYGDVQGFIRSGNSADVLNKMRSKASLYSNLDPIARARLAQQAGMSSRDFNTMLMSAQNAPMENFSDQLLSATAALKELSRATAKATNAADWVSSMHGTVGSVMNAVTQGGVAALPAASDVFMTAGSAAYLANVFTGNGLSRWARNKLNKPVSPLGKFARGVAGRTAGLAAAAMSLPAMAAAAGSALVIGGTMYRDNSYWNAGRRLDAADLNVRQAADALQYGWSGRGYSDEERTARRQRAASQLSDARDFIVGQRDATEWRRLDSQTHWYNPYSWFFGGDRDKLDETKALLSSRGIVSDELAKSFYDLRVRGASLDSVAALASKVDNTVLSAGGTGSQFKVLMEKLRDDQSMQHTLESIEAETNIDDDNAAKSSAVTLVKIRDILSRMEQGGQTVGAPRSGAALALGY